jgi:hypothetical protein
MPLGGIFPHAWKPTTDLNQSALQVQTSLAMAIDANSKRTGGPTAAQHTGHRLAGIGAHACLYMGSGTAVVCCMSQALLPLRATCTRCRTHLLYRHTSGQPTCMQAAITAVVALLKGHCHCQAPAGL